MKFDIVIYNGTVVTVNPAFEIFENGLICIKDGKIAQIRTAAETQSLPKSLQRIDAGGGIVLPGLVNTHTHLPMSLFRGLADDLPLMTWLNEHIFPAEQKHIFPESVRLGTMISCAEMLLSGTTTCCDGYFYEDHVAEAVAEAGMRAILGQGVIDFPAPGVPDPADAVQEAVSFVEKWQNRHPTITPSIFCHSPYTCTAETLRRAKEAASEKEILFQIHAAETQTEWTQIHSEHGVSPIQYLLSNDLLDKRTLLAHAVWIDTDDIAAVARHQTNVSHNPASNMKLSSGIAPVPELLRSGVTVGLGTDGCASNNALDLFHEMDLTAKLHKVHTLDPTVMDARTVLEMATLKGAETIGLGGRIGSLEVGKAADMIIMDIEKPHLTPMYSPVSHLVYAVKGSDVRDVIIDGKVIVRNGKLLTVDLEKVFEQMKAFRIRCSAVP